MVAGSGIFARNIESGSCKGAGEHEGGKLRPRGPSGDDCIEVFVGLEAIDGALGALGLLVEG